MEMKACILKEVDVRSSSENTEGMLFASQFFLLRHIKLSGFLKASFLHLTAISVDSSLGVVMELYLFQHCSVLLWYQKDVFVATPYFFHVIVNSYTYYLKLNPSENHE